MYFCVVSNLVGLLHPARQMLRYGKPTQILKKIMPPPPTRTRPRRISDTKDPMLANYGPSARVERRVLNTTNPPAPPAKKPPTPASTIQRAFISNIGSSTDKNAPTSRLSSAAQKDGTRAPVPDGGRVALQGQSAKRTASKSIATAA